MAHRPESTNWPLAGEAVTAKTESQAMSGTTGDEALSDTNSLIDVDPEHKVVGTTELYENGQIRLIPVSAYGWRVRIRCLANHCVDANSGPEGLVLSFRSSLSLADDSCSTTCSACN